MHLDGAKHARTAAPTRGRGDAPDGRGGSPRPAAGGRTPRGSSHEPSSRSSTPFERSDPCLASHPQHLGGGSHRPGARRGGVRTVGTGREQRVEPPRSAADGGRPADRQHGCLRVREPRSARLRHARQFVDPVRGAGRRPELLPLGRAHELRHQHRNDGGRAADITYRWKFTTHYRNPDTFLYNTGPVTSLNDPDLNIYQTYDLLDSPSNSQEPLLNNAKVAPSNVGDASMPNYNADLFDAAVTPSADDPSSPAGSGSPTTRSSSTSACSTSSTEATSRRAGDDTLDGFNVNTFALQVPTKDVSVAPTTGSSVCGARRRVRRMRIAERSDGSQTFSGKDVQVSRLGMPLVNEVVVPVGAKDYFNASKPKDDGSTWPRSRTPSSRTCSTPCTGVLPEHPGLRPGHPGIQRADLIQVFLTGVPTLNQPADVEAAEMLRLNMDIPPCSADCSTLGVIGGDLAGFPNGRRLDDDIIDVSLRVVMGVLLPGSRRRCRHDRRRRGRERVRVPRTLPVRGLPALRVGRGSAQLGEPPVGPGRAARGRARPPLTTGRTDTTNDGRRGAKAKERRRGVGCSASRVRHGDRPGGRRVRGRRDRRVPKSALRGIRWRREHRHHRGHGDLLAPTAGAGSAWAPRSSRSSSGWPRRRRIGGPSPRSGWPTCSRPASRPIRATTRRRRACSARSLALAAAGQRRGPGGHGRARRRASRLRRRPAMGRAGSARSTPTTAMSTA